MKSYIPLYSIFLKTNKLRKIINELKEHLISCDICPVKCKVNRIKNQTGKCRFDKE